MPEDSPKPDASAISRIAVAGFKSIDAEQHIDIAPLTLLAGANSAGKSSIMQPLLLWKQTLEAPFDPGPLLLNGPCVRFTSAEQIIFKGHNSFSIAAETEEGTRVEVEYARPSGGRLEIASMCFRRAGNEANKVIAPSSTPEQLSQALADAAESYGEQWNPRPDSTFSTKRSFAFLQLVTDDPIATYLALIRLADSRILEPASPLIPLLLDLIHIPGLRGTPERSYQTTEIGRHFPGTFDPYVASLINHWQQTDAPRHAALVQDLRSIGLTRQVQAERLDDSQVQLRVARLPAGGTAGDTDMVNIADVGFGVSQAMPVITALHAADAGRLVYIEQPELHLHPRAQAALADVLVRAANRGVRVVAETHSSILLRAVQTAVARNQIAPADVSLNWFARDPSTGATTVTRADLHDDGSFGDWPEDFDDVALDVEGAYLDAVEARNAT